MRHSENLPAVGTAVDDTATKYRGRQFPRHESIELLVAIRADRNQIVSLFYREAIHVNTSKPSNSASITVQPYTPHLHFIAIRPGADAIGVIRRQLAGIDEMAAKREACCIGGVFPIGRECTGTHKL